MTVTKIVQKELYCPACGKVLTWSCYGKEGHAFCEAFSTQLLQVKNTPYCMYRGTVRRLKNGVVRLNKPTKLEMLLERVVRRLKAHKEAGHSFRWISYAAHIALYEQTPYGYFLVATLRVQKDDIEMNNLEVTWDLPNEVSEGFKIPRTIEDCASKLDNLFSSLRRE
jgi:hypothetical protein